MCSRSLCGRPCPCARGLPLCSGAGASAPLRLCSGESATGPPALPASSVLRLLDCLLAEELWPRAPLSTLPLDWLRLALGVRECARVGVRLLAVKLRLDERVCAGRGRDPTRGAEGAAFPPAAGSAAAVALRPGLVFAMSMRKLTLRIAADASNDSSSGSSATLSGE